MVAQPILSEKKACPSAFRKVSAVTLEKSGLKRNSRPAPAPGRVTDRTAMAIMVRNSTGIMTLVYLSIPSLIPASSTRAVTIRKM